jgi:hypothetical protein
MEKVLCLSSIMSSEIPRIVTEFRDFELEERVVQILAHRGFRIGERKIMGRRELLSDEILITDEEWNSNEIPIISLPRDARDWSDGDLERFLQDQILPPLITSPSEMRPHRLLLIGGENQIGIREELILTLNRKSCSTVFAPFDERDLQTALIPTRRMEERARFDRFARAELALFLIDVERLALDRSEIARAHSLIEYRRRVHRHLRLGFILIGGRKSRRNDVASLLEPFPIFWIEDVSDDLLRIWPRGKSRGESKFREIEEWIGSPHGDSRESSDLPHHALTRGARSPRRIGGSMAAPR